MDGLWLGAAFLVWVAVGLWVWRGAARVRGQIETWPRQLRAVLGIAFLLASGALLVGGLAMLPPDPRQLTELGWRGFAAVAAGGLIFVALQTMTAVVLITLVQEGVTIGPVKSSNKQFSEGNEI